MEDNMNKLIAVVGMSGTGKSVITEYLEENNYTKLYFDGITYKLMKEAGIERTEDGKSEKEFREKLYAEIVSQYEKAKEQNENKAKEAAQTQATEQAKDQYMKVDGKELPFR